MKGYYLAMALGFFGLGISPCLAEIANTSTFERPFSASSLWNSRPVNPVFDDFEIPTSNFFPAVQNGKFSSACFLAKAEDPPMRIQATRGKKGVYDADSESFSNEIIIPHWPSELNPAEGGDGHADIFDIENGVIYSFWQLKKVDDVWRTTHFGWTRLDGSGWGDPAHYHQGARAAGVPSCAGIIRKNELNDEEDIFHHALAVSLTYNGLSDNPPFVFPATISDTNTSKNTGRIPEGALIMLPPEFDANKINNPQLKKIANTLKVYGAYVVDRNFGTPYLVYAEIGSDLNINNRLWDNGVADGLQLIRKNLRMVKSTNGWIDDNGKLFSADKNLNILSMRGPWVPRNNKPLGLYVSESQSVVFPTTDASITQSNFSERSISKMSWAKPAKGQAFNLSAVGKGGAKLRLQLLDKQTKQILFESKELQNNESVDFIWPADDFLSVITVTSGVGQSSSIRGVVKRQKAN